MRRSRGYTRRYSRRIKTVKYSNETVNATGVLEIASADAQQLALALIPPADVQGTRKCKNFEISISGSPWSAPSGVEVYTDTPLIWALVYVPQGTEPGKLNIGNFEATSSLYEPNQNVIMSGVLPASVTTNYRVKSRLARNLNSGDGVAFICRPAGTMNPQSIKSFSVNLNYAIAY